ncbi:hypothetical protein MUK42_28788 [Musa troglodytarum]|uniref:Uncharacterized protein n=1 Tax=Musa troglodytarum TaxID=320322 RepID=A0A9E7F536_9LILI|nr:hypothetical protein MUK42_28788 [Musa troglodytarum]
MQQTGDRWRSYRSVGCWTMWRLLESKGTATTASSGTEAARPPNVIGIRHVALLNAPDVRNEQLIVALHFLNDFIESDCFAILDVHGKINLGKQDLWALLAGSSSSCGFSIQKSFQEHMMMHLHGVENTGYTQANRSISKLSDWSVLRNSTFYSILQTPPVMSLREDLYIGPIINLRWMRPETDLIPFQIIKFSTLADGEDLKCSKYKKVKCLAEDHSQRIEILGVEIAGSTADLVGASGGGGGRSLSTLSVEMQATVCFLEQVRGCDECVSLHRL